MKFYFCEACGKRLTERDIDAGAARNKKLKGVYCKTCAVGVSTMDSLPMSKQEAREVLKDDRASSKAFQSQPARPVRRGTSATKLPPATSRGQSSRLPQNVVSNRTHYILFGATCLVIGVAAIAIMTSGAKKTQRSVATKTTPAKPVTVPAEMTVEEVRSTPAQAERDASSQPGTANSDSRTTKQPEPALTKPETESAPPTSQPPSQEQKEPKAITTTKEPKSTDASQPRQERGQPATEEEKKPSDPNRKLFFGELELLADSLRERRTEDALRIAKALAEQTEALGQWTAAGRDLAAAVSGLKKLWQVRVARLKNHLNKTVLLTNRKGQRLQGKLKEVKQDSIALAQTYVINGQQRERKPQTSPLAQIAPASLARLLKEAPPTSPEQWMVRGLEAVAFDDLKYLERALAKMEGLALKAPLEAWLEKRQATARESEAREAWESLMAEIRPKVTKYEAKRLLPKLTDFETVHGKTAFFANKKARFAELREAWKASALGMDRKIWELFRGTVKDASYRKMTATVLYDLKKHEQLEDFSHVEKRAAYGHGIHRIKEGVKLYSSATSDLMLIHNAFDPRQVTVRLKYRLNKKLGEGNPPKTHFGMWVGLVSSQEKPTNKGISYCCGRMSVLSQGLDRHGKCKKLHETDVVLPPEGELVLEIDPSGTRVRMNGKVELASRTAPEGELSGIALGGGYYVNMILQELEFSGRLNRQWVATQLRKRTEEEKKQRP